MGVYGGQELLIEKSIFRRNNCFLCYYFLLSSISKQGSEKDPSACPRQSAFSCRKSSFLRSRAQGSHPPTKHFDNNFESKSKFKAHDRLSSVEMKLDENHKNRTALRICVCVAFFLLF